MRYLVYKRPFGKSARLLATALRVRAVRSLPTGGGAVLSWGVRCAHSMLNGRINVSKLYQLQTWEAAGLSTLQFSTTPQPGWLARSGRSHGGIDFLTLPLNSPGYWTKPVPSSAEYRIHVFRKSGQPIGHPSSYQVIRIGWKVNSDPSLNKVVEGVQIKSRQYGWRLRYYATPNGNVPAELDLLCRWALASLDWDFGALDVIRKGERYYLVEANSAPGLLDEATCQAYATALREVIDGEGV